MNFYFKFMFNIHILIWEKALPYKIRTATTTTNDEVIESDIKKKLEICFPKIVKPGTLIFFFLFSNSLNKFVNNIFNLNSLQNLPFSSYFIVKTLTSIWAPKYLMISVQEVSVIISKRLLKSNKILQLLYIIVRCDFILAMDT